MLKRMLNVVIMNKYVCWAAYLGIALFLGLFLILPVGITVSQGLAWTPMREVLYHPVYQQGFINSLSIAVVTTVITFLIAVPLAWVTVRYRVPYQGVAEAAVLVPLIMPPFVGALGIFQLAGQYGVLNALGTSCGLWARGAGPDWLGDYRFFCVCLVESLHLYPILYLTVRASLARLDPSLAEAAAVAGAGPWMRFWRVTVPFMRPGLFAGGIIIAVAAFTDVGTPLILGFERVTPVQILWGMTELQTNPIPFSLIVVVLVLAGLGYMASRWLFVRSDDAIISKQSTLATTRLLSGWKAIIVWAMFIGVILLASLPHLTVALMAVAKEWYGTVMPLSYTSDHVRLALSHELVIPGIVNSMTYAGLATCLAVVLGTFIAWMNHRWRPRGWQMLDTIAMLPLAVPGIVLACGYLSMAMGIPWLRVWLDPIRDPTLLLVIAYGVRRLPYVVRSASAGFEQLPIAYEEAAAAVGAGPWSRLRRIVIPLLVSSIIAGALLTFSFSIFEVSDSLVLAQKREFFPVARVIYELVNILGPGPAIACAFAMWAMLFLASMFAVAAAVLGRRPGDLLRN